MTPPHEQPPDRPRVRISKQEAVRILRHVGIPRETIRKVEKQFPEVIDYERDANALEQLGISPALLGERFGSSP